MCSPAISGSPFCPVTAASHTAAGQRRTMLCAALPSFLSSQLCPIQPLVKGEPCCVQPCHQRLSFLPCHCRIPYSRWSKENHAVCSPAISGPPFCPVTAASHTAAGQSQPSYSSKGSSSAFPARSRGSTIWGEIFAYVTFFCFFFFIFYRTIEVVTFCLHGCACWVFLL